MEKNLSISEVEGLQDEYKNVLLALNLNKSELEEYNQLKAKMNTSRDKGKIFERMIKILFKDTLFHVKSNAYTSSNEIDFVIELNTYAKILRSKGIIPKWFSDYIIAECKNYNKSIEVGLVGKFYSLLNSYKDVRVGIFFSNKPISGHGEKYWKHASAFVNKVNLMGEKNLLDINLKYIDTKINTTPDDIGIIRILSNRQSEIQLDIHSNVYKNITTHENENKLSIN